MAACYELGSAWLRWTRPQEITEAIDEIELSCTQLKASPAEGIRASILTALHAAVLCKHVQAPGASNLNLSCKFVPMPLPTWILSSAPGQRNTIGQDCFMSEAQPQTRHSWISDVSDVKTG